MLRSETDCPEIPQIDRKRCPECLGSMRLAWIGPGERSGYDRRTFECMHCDHWETVTVKYA